jgi:hypothetical protein
MYQSLARSSKRLHGVSQNFGDETSRVLFICRHRGVQGALDHLEDKWGLTTSLTLVSGSHPEYEEVINKELIPKLLDQCSAVTQATGQPLPLRFLCISDRLCASNLPRLASTFEHLSCMEGYLPFPRITTREDLKKTQLAGIAALDQLTGLTSLRLKTTLGEDGDMQKVLPLKLIRFGWEGRHAVDAAGHLTRMEKLRHLQLSQPHCSADVANLAPLTQVETLELSVLGMQPSLCDETSLQMLGPKLVSLEFHKFLSTTLEPLQHLTALTRLTALHLPENLKLPVLTAAGQIVMHDGKVTWTCKVPKEQRQTVGKAVEKLVNLNSLTLNACKGAQDLIKEVDTWPPALRKLELIDADPNLVCPKGQDGNVNNKLMQLTALTWLHIRPQQCTKGVTWDTLLPPLGTRLIHLKIAASMVRAGNPGGSWLHSMERLETLEIISVPLMEKYYEHKWMGAADELEAALRTGLGDNQVPNLKRLLLHSRWNFPQDGAGMCRVRKILTELNRSSILVALEPRCDWSLRTTQRMGAIVTST